MEYRDLGYNFLLGIDYELDDQDGINSRNVDELLESGSVSFDYTTMSQLSPNQDMESENFIPGVQGWKIYGDGYAEFSGLTLTGGIIRYNKTSFSDSVNSGYYISPQGIYFGGANDITKLKFNITTGQLEFIGAVSGRDSAALAAAINSDADLITDVINARLDTEAKQILAGFTFGVSGALQIGTYVAGVSGDIKISPNGIVGRNKNNQTTFTINGATGDATFYGELAAAYGTFGTISAGILTGTLTVGGRLATTIGSVIDVNGYFISELVNTKIKTTTKEILSDFDFGTVDYAGALLAGNLTWNITTGAITGGSGIAIYRKGIVGANAGVPTFTISAVDGSAYFKGDIGSGSNITAPNITGGTIIGASIQTSAGAPNMILNTNNLTGYDAGPLKRMQLDRDSLEFSNASALRTMTLDNDGITIWDPGSLTDKRMEISTDGSYTYIDGGYSIYGTVMRSLRSGTPAIAMFYHDGTTAQLIMQGSNQRVSSNYFAVGASGYINFGTTYGSAGYGFRSNSDVLEYYDTGSGGWKAFNSIGGLPAGVTLNMMYYTGFNWAATSTLYVGGLSGGTISYSSSRIVSSTDFVATGSLHATGNVYTGGISDDDGAVYAKVLSTTGNDMNISSDRNVYLDSGTGYQFRVGYYNRPANINLNYSVDVNFWQSGVVKAIIDDNIWTQGDYILGSGSNAVTISESGGSLYIDNQVTITSGSMILSGTGATFQSAGSGIKIGSTWFYPTSITYKDGSGVNQTKTFLVA